MNPRRLGASLVPSFEQLRESHAAAHAPPHVAEPKVKLPLVTADGGPPPASPGHSPTALVSVVSYCFQAVDEIPLVEKESGIVYAGEPLCNAETVRFPVTIILP